MIGQIRLLMILMAFLLLGTLSNAVLAVRVTEPEKSTVVSSLAEQRVVQLSSEGDHTCVLTSDGQLRCWGRNEFGQLNTPADIGPISQLSTGHVHTCVITTAQLLRCWGWNDDGQSAVPADLGRVLQVGAGVYQTCAVTISGQVRCWGQNNFGQLNIPSDLGTATQVSTGNTHVCAIQSSGMLRCWNRDDFGQSTVPADLGPVTQVSTGDYHACAITTSGMLRCWGHNGEGRSSVPSDLGPVTQVSAGATNTCAITTSSNLRCWGHDGGGSNVVPSDLGPVTQVGAGWAHTCALTKAGSVRCWGWNGHGQTNVPDDLLNPPVTPSATPPKQPSTTAAPTTTILPGQSILLNGSFEQPVVPTSHFSTYGTGQTFGHWTVSAGSIDLLSVRDWQAADGQQSIDLSGGEAGTIYQDLATTIGATYQVSLAIAGNPTDVPSVKQAEVWWGSSLLATLSFSTSGHSHQSMGWQFHTFTVQASAPVTRLRLKSLTNGSNGPAIDAVRVVPLDTPTATATNSPTATPTNSPIVTPTVAPGGLQLRMITPDRGVNGQATRVTVIGSGFSTQLPPTAQLVGTSGIFELNALSVLSGNIFEATVPAGLTPGIYDLMVRSNGDTRILANAFWVLVGEDPTATATPTPTASPTATFTPTPTATPSPTAPSGLLIESIAPREGLTGQESTVTVIGSGITTNPTPLAYLINATGAFPLTNLAPLSSSSFTATVPRSLAVGSYNLLVISDGQSSTLPNAFNILSSEGPQLTQIEPSSGINDRAIEIQITGNSFADQALVYLGSTALGSTRISPQLLTAVIPAEFAPGRYQVRVSNPDGRQSSAELDFTLLAAAGSSGDDLTSSSEQLWFDPVIARADVPVSLGLFVERTGGKNSLEDVAVAFRRDGINGPTIGRTTIDFLDPRSSESSRPLTMTFGSAEVGAVTIYAIIDPDREVAEHNESNNVISRTLTIHPAAADQTVPVVSGIIVNGGNSDTVRSRQLGVDISADDPMPSSGVQAIHLIEYVYQDGSQGWVPQAQSGWLSFGGSPSRYIWTLAPQPGVRYLQVRARDGAGNISIGQARRLLNYEPPSDTITRGQTRIYRYQVAAGESLEVSLEVQSGDADLYVWSSRADQSAWVSNLPDDAEEYVHVPSSVEGIYQVEVYGYREATYRIQTTIGNRPAAAPLQNSGGRDPTKVVPSRPLVAVDDLPDERAGSVPVEPVPQTNSQRVFLPLIRR